MTANEIDAYWESVDKQVKNLVGHTLEEVQSVVEAGGWDFRIMSKDKRFMIITCDVKENRINVSVENGIVTEANRG